MNSFSLVAGVAALPLLPILMVMGAAAFLEASDTSSILKALLFAATGLFLLLVVLLQLLTPWMKKLPHPVLWTCSVLAHLSVWLSICSFRFRFSLSSMEAAPYEGLSPAIYLKLIKVLESLLMTSQSAPTNAVDRLIDALFLATLAALPPLLAAISAVLAFTAFRQPSPSRQ